MFQYIKLLSLRETIQKSILEYFNLDEMHEQLSKLYHQSSTISHNKKIKLKKINRLLNFQPYVEGNIKYATYNNLPVLIFKEIIRKTIQIIQKVYKKLLRISKKIIKNQ